MGKLPQPIGLALYGLKELLPQDVVRGVEGNGHPLAASRGDRERVCVTTANDVYRDGQCCRGKGGEQIRKRTTCTCTSVVFVRSLHFSYGLVTVCMSP